MSDTQSFGLLRIKCGKCGTPLLRATKPEAYDRVFCSTCEAVGSYEEVIEGGGGLVRGLLTPEEIKYLHEQFRLTRKNAE